MKALFCLGLLIAGCAAADTFDWSFSVNCYLCGPFVNSQGMPVNIDGSPATLFVQANGTFTTTDIPVNGALTITGITGTRTTNWFMGNYLYPAETDTITGLIPSDPTNPYGLTIVPDNLLFPQGPTYLDASGVAFKLNCSACGDYGFSGIVQIAGIPVSNYFELGFSGLSAMTSFTLTPTPEPATIALFGMAASFAGIVGLKRRWLLARTG